ncbi:MAG: HNH endonuclease [Dehalococcoidia bacterium]
MESGCPALSLTPRCPTHTKVRRKEQSRADAANRGPEDAYYHTARWQKLRGLALRRSPLCVRCLEAGRTVVATVADHVLPRKAGGEDSLDNLEGLCATCHGKKSAEDRRSAGDARG